MDRDTDIDRATREAGLVEALYSSPATLAWGAITTIFICAFCAHQTGDLAFVASAAVGFVIMCVRLWLYRASQSRRTAAKPRSMKQRRGVQAIGLGTLACLHLGATTAYAIIHYGNSSTEWALVCIALANGMGIIGRSFASALAVRLQSAGLCLPMAAAFAWTGDGMSLAMAGLSIVMVLVINDFAAGPRNILLSSLEQQVATRRLSRTDALTELSNRAHFFEEGDAMLKRLPADARVGVAILDLDGLKRINDARGHRVGDRVISRVGRRIAHAELGTVLCARLGGDEFAALWHVEGDSGPEPTKIAAMIAKNMNFTIRDRGHRIEVKTSTGLFIGEKGELGLERLIERADYAQYVAKRDPERRVALFDCAMSEAMLRRDVLREDLPLAIANAEVRAVFQPIVQSVDARIIAFEALARWRHPKLGQVPPDEFIALAEANGHIPALTPHDAEPGRGLCHDAAGPYRRVGQSVRPRPDHRHRGRGHPASAGPLGTQP